MAQAHGLISIVVPLYNEADGLENFHASLLEVLKGLDSPYEIIYCDDGSTDKTPEIVRDLHAHDKNVRLLRLSRNFGKEITLSAGINESKGEAVLMIDGDGQHPVELIPKFVEAWKSGTQVVVGVRTNKKRLSSRLFYRVFNRLTGQKLIPGSTDFRLIDKVVQQEFVKLNEADRITRGLIDWLGFKRELIYFKAKARTAGQRSYSRGKLVKLAANSFVSMSSAPLYIFGYIGFFTSVAAFLLGSAVFIEQLVLEDPLNWNFTGTAMLGILILFLVGILLTSQGILSLYISHIHSQSKQRPLYVVDYQASAGITRE